MTPINEILRGLFHEKTRIILTIFALAWGTFSIAIMLAIGEGLRINFIQTMQSAGSNLLTINAGTTSKNYLGTHINTKIYFSHKDLLSITQLPNVDAVTPEYSFDTKMIAGDKNLQANLLAVAPSYITIHNINVENNQRFINISDLQQRNKVVVLGSYTAATLFPKTDNSIGKTVFINNFPFLVIGVMQKKAQMMTETMPLERLNWIPTTTYELLNNPQSITSLAISYKSYHDLPQTQAHIQKLIAFNHGVAADDNSIVKFSEIAKNQATVNNFFIGMQIFLGIIGGLTLLIAGVGIANVMYAAITRSTREIGIRMALGATAAHILQRFVLESMLVTLIGGIIGIIITVLFVALIRILPLNAEIFQHIGKPQPILSFTVLLIVILVLGSVGFLAGFFPALKAAKIDPAEALNYE